MNQRHFTFMSLVIALLLVTGCGSSKESAEPTSATAHRLRMKSPVPWRKLLPMI